MKPRLVGLAALTLAAVAVTATRPLAAQGAQVRLAFGYECGDRYLVRNDGTNDVDVEYGVAGDPQRWPVHLKGKESVEVSSASSSALELRVGGRIVSTAHNGNRPCSTAPVAPAEQAVVVRPIDEGEYVTPPQPAPQVVYSEPRVVYVEQAPIYVTPRPYYYYYPRPTFSVILPLFGGWSSHNRTVVVERRGPAAPARSYPVHAVPRGGHRR